MKTLVDFIETYLGLQLVFSCPTEWSLILYLPGTATIYTCSTDSVVYITVHAVYKKHFFKIF